jgi:hypothetical protein
MLYKEGKKRDYVVVNRSMEIETKLKKTSNEVLLNCPETSRLTTES